MAGEEEATGGDTMMVTGTVTGMVIGMIGTTTTFMDPAATAEAPMVLFLQQEECSPITEALCLPDGLPLQTAYRVRA